MSSCTGGGNVTKCHIVGGGSKNWSKKCHSLFEWPLIVEQGITRQRQKMYDAWPGINPTKLFSS